MIPSLLLLLLSQVPSHGQTTAAPGTDAPFALTVQGVTGGKPIPISGTVNTSGAADTVGASQTFSSNGLCAFVATAGQTGAGFVIQSGTLAATLTPSVSTDSTNGTNGNWTATSFVDISGNKTSTLVLTNPNAAQAFGLVLEAGVRYAKVCTTAYTSGSAAGNLVASTPQPPPPAAGADVTDRWARQVGQVDLARVLGAAMAATNPVWAELTDGTSGYVGTKTGQLPSALDASGGVKTHEVGTAAVSGTVTANAGTGTFATSNTALTDDAASSAAASESATTRLSATTVLRGLDTSQGAGSQLVPIKATTNALWVSVQNSPTVTANAGTGTFNIQSNASMNLAQVAGSTTATSGTGIQKVGVTGNAGASMDAAGQNAASPANELLVGAQFNTTPTTITSGNISPLQLDSSGNLLVNIKAGGGSGGGPADVAATSAASESDTARQKTFAAVRLLDTAQGAGSQLVTAKGDQTSGLWVNCKAGCSSAGDTTGAQQTLTALNNAATVAMAGENSLAVQLTSSTSPVFTIVAECSLDGGSTYGNTLTFVSNTGTTATSLANPANGTYSLVLPPGCSGATNARVRVSAYTSGSVVAQLRATANSPSSEPYSAAIGANSYPPAGVAVLAQDSATTTTTRAIRASANGVLVDGSGVTQPISGTVTANAGTGNFATNLAQVNGSTVSTAASGTQKVGVVGNSGAAMDAAGQNVASPANELIIGGQFNTSPTTITSGNVSPIQLNSSGSVKVDGSAVTQPISGTTTANQGSAAALSGAWPTKVTDGTNTMPTMDAAGRKGFVAVTDGTNTSAVKAASTVAASTDPALVTQQSPLAVDVCTSTKAISQTASTDLVTSSAKLHICSIMIVSASAQSVSLVEGTGTTCATGTAAVIGATAAAAGMSLAANGGFSMVAARPFLVTATTADHLCLLQSGAGQVSGVITYRDQ